MTKSSYGRANKTHKILKGTIEHYKMFRIYSIKDTVHVGTIDDEYWSRRFSTVNQFKRSIPALSLNGGSGVTTPGGQRGAKRCKGQTSECH